MFGCKEGEETEEERVSKYKRKKIEDRKYLACLESRCRDQRGTIGSTDFFILPRVIVIFNSNCDVNKLIYISLVLI